MTIRVGRGTLSFSVSDNEGNISFSPYVVKSGVSMAANLREAFKSSPFLQQLPIRVRVLIDADVLVMPINLFDESHIETLYSYSFPSHRQDIPFYNVISELDTVVVSSINKDLKLVVDDHFRDVKTIVAVSPVWRHMHQRSFTGKGQKLYGYVHERRLEVFGFQQNRFRFCNSFDVKHMKDACYFLLYVWNQLQMDALVDELHLVGDLFMNDTATNVQERNELLADLRKFVKNVYVVNPSADFNRSPITEIKGMPYDLQTLFVKGR